MYSTDSFRKLGTWAGFMGVMSIIGGILQLITIVGIIPGIIMIIMGSKLLGAKSSAKAIAAFNGEMPAGQLNKMVDDLRSYFQITGIITIIAFSISALLIIAGILGMFAFPWEAWINELNQMPIQ